MSRFLFLYIFCAVKIINLLDAIELMKDENDVSDHAIFMNNFSEI